MDRIPCPFKYANGKRCEGHISRVEAYKADLAWEEAADGTWSFGWGQPRSHFHMFCSLKGNHAGYKKEDSSQLRRYYDQLPEGIRQIMSDLERSTTALK